MSSLPCAVMPARNILVDSEPIRAREKHYSLVWYMAMGVNVATKTEGPPFLVVYMCRFLVNFDDINIDF